MAVHDPPNERNVTEQVNPDTADLDCLPSRDVLARIIDEDTTVPGAVRKALPRLTDACDMLATALERGGRWINVGAGTSGRIGLLDAAEIPPTFGLSPDCVRGLIAGGEAAVLRAVEGAEDDAKAAERDLGGLGVGEADCVVCLSASGTTPYVIAAARAAGVSGAASIGVTCAPGAPLSRAVDLAIEVPVGPEVIAGSTRMKGGLAQKMILHALSTAVMVRLGRVRGNRMVSLQALNAKLRHRAIEIVMDLAGLSRGDAEAALAEAGGSVAAALDSVARR